MTKFAAAVAALAVTMALAIAALPMLVATALAGHGPPSQAAITGIPAAMLAHYQQAGTRCVAISWAILAGVGQVETGHGQNRIDPESGATIGPPILSYHPLGPDTDHGRYDDPTSDWAVGPMLITPATFTAYPTAGDARPAGAVADPSNAWNAIATAAHYLCDLARMHGDVDVAVVVAAYNCGPHAPNSCGADYASRSSPSRTTTSTAASTLERSPTATSPP